MKDPWTLKRPRTEKEMEALRKEAIDLTHKFITFKNKTYTCDNCDRKHVCTLAYDAYNTNGDCIYVK